MSLSNYVGVSIPRELAERIQFLIDSQKSLGYKTVTEFVKDAIREKLLTLEETKETKEQSSELDETLERITRLERVVDLLLQQLQQPSPKE